VRRFLQALRQASHGLQRFRCRLCGTTFTEDHAAPFRVEDYLNTARGIMAIQLLVEGCSIRTTERITGLHRDAIMRLLLAAGERCERLMDTLIQDVPARDVQADEIWSFVGKKEKNTTFDDSETLGDSYCWVAIEARTKLVLSFVVGKRSVSDAIEFTQKNCAALPARLSAFS